MSPGSPSSLSRARVTLAEIRLTSPDPSEGHGSGLTPVVRCEARRRRSRSPGGRAPREVGPELLDVLEPDERRSRPRGMRSPSQRQRLSIDEATPPSEVWFAISFVAVSTCARAVGDVEGDQPAEARVADAQHGRVLLEPRARSRARLGLAAHAQLERAQPAQQGGRRVGRGREAESQARVVERFRALGVARHGAPSSAFEWPVEVLRRRVHADVGALVERAQEDGRRDGRVADRRGPDARERPPSRASSATGSRAPRARARRRRRAAAPVWSNSTTSSPQRLELAQRHAGAEVAPSASATVMPGRQNASTQAVAAAVPDA